MEVITRDIISVSLVLFSVIDILGSIPIIISMKKKGIKIESKKASIAACLIMILFLYAGEEILKLFHVDLASFAVAGSIIIFLIGIEMILGIHLFREEPDSKSSSIVPIAFPLIAGAGTLTTILSLKSEFNNINIFLGIIINILLVFLVLHFSDFIERKLGNSGAEVLRKVFGIILLAISIRLFKENIYG
ncbi:MarC family protein [Membranihabitans marinus]|uniref:MarC family protein n=1 Tax=Membranihabitans marinus TaxID=1227546 RepID=UPI001F40A1FC|nr:MarC family protein [Membranihabitans marinus]